MHSSRGKTSKPSRPRVRTSLRTALCVAVLLLCGHLALASNPGQSEQDAPPGLDLLQLNQNPGERAATLPATLSTPLQPSCRLELNQAGFNDGETVKADWRLANPSAEKRTVELKLWFAAPGEAAVSLSDALAEGQRIELPGELDESIGEISLFAIDDETPRGQYEMSCRLLDPVTGELLHEDRNLFRIL